MIENIEAALQFILVLIFSLGVIENNQESPDQL
jgi:hypothetical protein